MSDEDKAKRAVTLPDDLVGAVDELSERLGESPRDIVIAAVDHFTRIPEQQRKAIIRGTSMRRRE
jgi:predicted transcriptional regulator